ncbi:MAG TPA: hypothetical protein VGE04_02300 [Chloroflexia bacterium]
MAGPTFQPLDQTLLYLPQGATTANARAAYLLPSTVTNPPPNIDLSESLTTYGGVYLFFPVLPYSAVDPTVLGNFIADVQTFLEGTGQQTTLFLWIANPLSTGSGIVGTTQQATNQSGVVSTQQSNFIALTPNTNLRISGGTQITPSGDGSALVFTPAEDAPNVLLVTPNGSQEQQTIPLTDNMQLALLSGTLPSGCFTLCIAPGMDELAYLGAGLRYFATDLNPDSPPGFVKALPYPVFELGDEGTLPLFGVLDPLDALNPARAYFLFGTRSAPSTGPIGSYFRSALNAPLTIAPQAGAQLQFAVDVIAQTDNGQPDPTNPYYLTPAGEFQLALPAMAAESGQFAQYLMCGVSGVEYFQVPNGTTGVKFIPGFPGFSPATVQKSSQSLAQSDGPGDEPPTPSFKGLTPQALSSWAYLTGSEAYYAQPESSVLHQPDNTHPSFLSYLPVLSGQLTAPVTTATSDSVPQAFPLVPYAGVQPAVGLDYALYEAQVLNPTRRNAIYNINPAYKASSPGPDAATNATGTTPQGLLLQLADGDWEVLTLAQTPSADTLQICDCATGACPASTGPTSTDSVLLQLGDVKGALQAGLQTNQLFMVASSGSKLLANADVPSYQLTVQSWTDLEQSQAPVVPQAILDKLKPLEDKLFPCLKGYKAALQAALGSDYNTYAAVLVQVGASFGVTIASWHFDFSPYFWQNYQTLLIFKFIDSPFINLVQDTGSWASAADLNDDPASTQQALLAYLTDAQKSTDPNLKYFQDTVLNDPSWNGILALRARVPLSSLPAEIEGIAAGIDPSKFFAHHVGITVTPIQPDTMTPLNSTLFGLISYNDPADLTNEGVDYQFKVQNLSVLFVNSEVSNFASTIEVMINSLFGEPAQLQNSKIGNNIKLNGVYQKHGGSGSYTFSNSGNNVFQVTSQVLDTVVVNYAQFITIVPPGGVQVGEDVQTKFALTGDIAFKALPGFDIFSFGSDAGTGGLAYSGLAIDMAFAPDSPNQKTFSFDAQNILFNTALSVARPDSLYPHFPLKLTGLIQATQGQTPPKLNYMPVDSVLTGSQLSGGWFGLVFDLNLGSLGALAGQLGFVASLLLGWQPNPKNYTVYIGLQIPGATGGKREISLEGVVKLTFGDLRFVVAGEGAYILQMRNIALSVLSISFPPGQTDILLFGDPAGTDNSTLGWYAAYKKANQGGSGGSGQKALPPAPAAGPPQNGLPTPS